MSEPMAMVLFGGSSNERLVSTASAQNILANLPTAGAWFLSQTGEIFQCTRQQVLAAQNPFTEEFYPGAKAARFVTLDAALQDPVLKNSVWVLALHGQGAEDGELQRKLESAAIAFTGSGAKASALAFDKIQAKNVAKRAGVPVAKHWELRPHSLEQIVGLLQECLRDVQKVILKPVADGSSVGLQILQPTSNLEQVAKDLLKTSCPFFIEEFVTGIELTVGVVDTGHIPEALPPSEVRLKAAGSSFDYNAKYLGQGAEEITPAKVSPHVRQMAQEVALQMHIALGCEGYSRTDLIVGAQGPIFLETNTLPGLTRASFFPQQLAASGRTLREFLTSEMERARAKARLSSEENPARHAHPEAPHSTPDTVG